MLVAIVALLLATIVAGCASRAVKELPEASEALSRFDASWNQVGGQRIGRVSGRPFLFVPGDGATYELSFTLRAKGKPVIVIYDESGTAIRLMELDVREKGRQLAEWDGADQGGAMVGPGVYFYAIGVLAQNGQLVAAYGADPVDGGEEVLPMRFTFDDASGRVSYALPEPARVRLRAMLQGLPLLRTIHDWQPQAAGEYEVVWDGTDSSGVLDMSGDSRVRFSMHAYALGRNAIVVPAAHDERSPRQGETSAFRSGFRHALHAPRDCHDPRFAVELVDPDGLSSGGVAKISGPATVRVTLDPEDLPNLVSGGFEVMFFLDSVFLFEEEEGSSPFNFTLAVDDLSPGLHFLTVNVLTYDDHGGAVTVPFILESSGSSS